MNQRSCAWCSSIFTPEYRNFKRGLGRCCNKSCAAKHREHKKMLVRTQTPKHFTEL